MLVSIEQDFFQGVVDDELWQALVDLIADEHISIHFRRALALMAGHCCKFRLADWVIRSFSGGETTDSIIVALLLSERSNSSPATSRAFWSRLYGDPYLEFLGEEFGSTGASNQVDSSLGTRPVKYGTNPNWSGEWTSPELNAIFKLLPLAKDSSSSTLVALTPPPRQIDGVDVTAAITLYNQFTDNLTLRRWLVELVGEHPSGSALQFLESVMADEGAVGCRIEAISALGNWATKDSCYSPILAGILQKTPPGSETFGVVAGAAVRTGQADLIQAVEMLAQADPNNRGEVTRIIVESPPSSAEGTTVWMNAILDSKRGIEPKEGSRLDERIKIQCVGRALLAADSLEELDPLERTRWQGVLRSIVGNWDALIGSADPDRAALHEIEAALSRIE